MVAFGNDAADAREGFGFPTMGSGWLLGILLLSLASIAGAATYTLTGAVYTSTTGAVYSGKTGITGSFVTPVPLPAGLTDKNIAAVTGCVEAYCVSSWSFFDGVFTYDETNSVPFDNLPRWFAVTTDTAGNLVKVNLSLVQPKTGAVAGQPANFIYLGENSYVQGMTGPCFSLHGGLCDSWFQGVSYASGGTYAFTSPMQPVVAASVPTLSEWALFALIALLAAATLRHCRRAGGRG